MHCGQLMLSGLLRWWELPCCAPNRPSPKNVGTFGSRALSTHHPCAVVCCGGWLCRYFSHDYETGLLVHTAKSAAMMAATIAAFCYTGYMYITGTSTPKHNTNPGV